MKKQSETIEQNGRKNLIWLFVITTILLFFARFYFHPYYLKANREQCHTGAIASDILEHGLRFSPFEYMPERYENGIFLEGLAAVPFFALFGRNVFALKFLGFITGALTMCVCLWLIRMVSEDKESAPGFNPLRATIYYFLLTAFGPPMFIYMSVSALGDHNEGALAVSMIFALYAWRHRSRSWISNFLLWCFCGFAVFWEKGSVSAVALVAIWTAAISLHRKTSDSRNFVSGAVAFLIGFSPAIIASVARHGADIADVTAKFRLSQHSSIDLSGIASDYLRSVFTGFGENPVLLAVAAICIAAELVWFMSLFRRKNSFNSIFSTRSMILFFILGFGAIQILLTHRDITDHFQYWLVLIFYLIASWVSRGVDKVESDNRPFVRTAGSSALFIAVVLSTNWSAVNSDTRALPEIKRDVARAACYWRFGRAFYIDTDNPDRAVEKCRSFGGDKTLQCISGISTWRDTRPENLDRREAAAFAFGVGYQISHPDEIRTTCSRFPGSERKNCAGGALAKLAINDWESWNITFNRTSITALPCKIDGIPFSGYERKATDVLVVLPDKFSKLCNSDSIQPNCGIYQSVCAQTPVDCFSLESRHKNECLDIFDFINSARKETDG